MEKLLASKKKITRRDWDYVSRNHTTFCRGTIEEIGHAKALKKYVVVIVRTTTKHHPFEYGSDYIANSLEDAVDNIIKEFGK